MQTRFPILALAVICAARIQTRAGDEAERPAAFPLKVSEDRRFLVGQDGRPFLLIGDSPWSLIAEPAKEGVDRYLDDRKAKGFTVLLVNLIEHKFSSRPPDLRDGTPPFVPPGDFGSPNEAYFRYAESVVRKAGERGLAVLLCPAYLGSGGGDEGFYREMLRSGREKVRRYGRFVGGRFRSHPNVFWIAGGDYDPPAENRWVVDEVAGGIREADPLHLITVHCGPGTPAAGGYGDRAWLDVDDVYSYREELYADCWERDAHAPRRPYFLVETAYEGEHHSTPDRIRRQAYWPLLSGACGVLYGNSPLWHFGSRGVYDHGGDWVAAMDSQGGRDMARLARAFRGRPWWELRPDREHQLVTAGFGKFGGKDFVTAARAADGRLALAYVPSTGKDSREINVDLSRLQGPVQASWFNPVDGRSLPIQGSPFPASGARALATPGDNGSGTNDWLLVLETAAAGVRRP